MLMKVFNKGQVVIPAEMRRALGIEIGDNLDVRIDRERGTVELRKIETFESEALAGSLSSYGGKKEFPSRESMADALAKGLRHEA